jgi:hypothetical protein
MCGVLGDGTEVGCCDICSKDICFSYCTVMCNKCHSRHCDTCVNEHKPTLECKSCSETYCHECFSYSKDYPDTFLCGDCIEKSYNPDDNWKGLVVNEYMIDKPVTRINRIKRMRISKEEPLYYHCGEHGEQGPHLPYGVIDSVFSYVSDKDRLFNISLVCKHYRNVLMSNTNIWMNGNGTTVATQKANMLFVYNIPTQKISFPIQCVGMSLKIINYVLRNRGHTKPETIIPYWPKTIDSFRCAYAVEVMKYLFGGVWIWKTGFTENLLTYDYDSLDVDVNRGRKFTQLAISDLYDTLSICRLLTCQDLSKYGETSTESRMITVIELQRTPSNLPS